MKKAMHLLILFVGVYFSANCQTMPTVREIYNFDVNDEFHFSEEGDPSIWIQVTRFVVTDKYYSAANDTVFYRLSYNNYSIDNDLKYRLHHYYENVFYTNLDSLISARYASEYIDSCNTSIDTLFYSSDLCGILSYKHSRCEQCCYEGFGSANSYGVGIGNFYSYNIYLAYPHPHSKIEMFYYKKGDIECGVPNLTNYLSVNETETESKIIKVYPNPADDVIHFNTGSSTRSGVAVFNSLGIIVLYLNEYLDGPVNTSSLDNGLYFVRIENDLGLHSCIFVIDRN